MRLKPDVKEVKDMKLDTSIRMESKVRLKLNQRRLKFLLANKKIGIVMFFNETFPLDIRVFRSLGRNVIIDVTSKK